MNSRKILSVCLFALLAQVLTAQWAVAAPAEPAGENRDTDPDNWDVSAGLGVGWAPEYRGADSHEVIPLPWLQVRKGGFFFNPIGGVGYDLLASSQWKLAPVLTYSSGRDNKGALSDFDDVDDSILAGVAVGWKKGHWKFDADVAKPVTGDLEGVLARAFFRYRGRISERLNYGVGPGVSWGNGDWNQALFDVSTADAARSGLDRYKADGAFLRSSLNGRLTYFLTRQVHVTTIARYSRLFGDAADSPIVSDVGDENQWFGSVLMTYQF